MAGFRDRATDLVDLRTVPYPAITVVVDFGEGLLVVDDGNGRQQRGSVVAGLAPGSIRVRGRDIECLQVRLSPVVAHAVLGASTELGGTVVALDDLWGRDATRTQEQLRAAASWDDRFAIVGGRARSTTRGWPGGRPRGRLRLGADGDQPGPGSGRPAGSRGRMEPKAPLVPVPIPARRHPQARRAARPFRPRRPSPRRGCQRRPGGGGERLRRPVPPPSGRHGLRRGDAHGCCGRAVARGRRRRVGRPSTRVTERPAQPPVAVATREHFSKTPDIALVTLRVMRDTTPSSTIADLFTHDLHFESSGTICAEERRMADGDADWRPAIFHAETDADVHADHWEKHPLADEAGLPARRDPPLSPRRPAGQAGRSRPTTPWPGRDRAPRPVASARIRRTGLPPGRHGPPRHPAARRRADDHRRRGRRRWPTMMWS